MNSDRFCRVRFKFYLNEWMNEWQTEGEQN
jgi:hypothetical protein